MKTMPSTIALVLALLLGTGCRTTAPTPGGPTQEAALSTATPAPLDMQKARTEVETRYAGAQPEIKEYVLWTAQTFGRSGMWLNEDAFAALPAAVRQDRIQYLVTLFEQADYGRHLCAGLAEASALEDQRLVPGLMKVAGYQREDLDYDCRPKWMAIAALARQEAHAAVPLLVSLVDHGNQNTRNWARAALARKMGKDFSQDKQAWAKCWQEQGHNPIAETFLKPYEVPSQTKK